MSGSKSSSRCEQKRTRLACSTSANDGAEFAGWAEFPIYLDARRAVVVDYFYSHGSLRMIDLDSGSTEVLTPSDLNLYGLAGRAAGGEIVFSAFHSTTDPGVTTPRGLR